MSLTANVAFERLSASLKTKIDLGYLQDLRGADELNATLQRVLQDVAREERANAFVPNSLLRKLTRRMEESIRHTFHDENTGPEEHRRLIQAVVMQLNSDECKEDRSDGIRNAAMMWQATETYIRDNQPQPPADPVPPPLVRISDLDSTVLTIFERYRTQDLVPIRALRDQVTAFVQQVSVEAESSAFVDFEMCCRVADTVNALFDKTGDKPDEVRHRLLQAAALYFIEEDDAQGDMASVFGFDDDEQVARAVAAELAALS